MTEIVISVAAKVAEYLVHPTIRLGEYLFCANKITGNLLQKKEELVLEKDRIQRRIDEATKKTEIIEDKVETWMNGVTYVVQEVEILEREMEANKCCYQGWCPTWRRYRLCEQMVEKTKIMTDFKHGTQFDPFSHLASLPGIEYESSKDFTFFESTKRAYNRLFEALRDDSTCMIGLYGIGGGGKTTLVTEVGKKAKELKLFDQVLSVTVSQTPDIRSIQGKMADMLNLELKDESKEGRAQRLYQKLKSEKSVLIIVDDVWGGEFNLKDIGIEFNESNKGSHKVLLTTRRRQVCRTMGCEEIPLRLLSEEEAWNLFRSFAAMDDQSSFSMIEDVARNIVGECKGLPIAIKAVASSLKGKLNQIHEWKVALRKLKHAKPIDVEEGMRDAFSCLKLSYDYLKDKEAEFLFFVCAMFPEDYEIPVEDLIRYGIGLGVCGEYESFDIARCNIRVSLDKLLDSCLLETCERRPLFEDLNGTGSVKMHDMVRDLALWMASKEDHSIKLKLVEDVNSLVGLRDAKDCFTISLRYRKFQETDHQLDAPKLEVLILNTEKAIHLSSASFEGMKGLKVLAIINRPSYRPISLFPQSIGSLSNLRTLRLCGWELDDMSFIVSLQRLEVLILQRCCFKDVPDEIEKLSKLKLLDLTDCQIEENNNLKRIEKCSQLEELYVLNTSANFSQCCAHYATAPNLQRYILTALPKKERMFEFEYIATQPFAKRILFLGEGSDFLSGLGDFENIVPDMEKFVGGLRDLTELYLGLSTIEYLIDTTSELGDSFQENAVFDRLIKLELRMMKNLKKVCHGAPPADFFKSLKEVHITGCEQLHSIFPLQCNLCNLKILNIGHQRYYKGTHCTAVGLFSMSVAQSLKQLEELTVGHCLELRHIITNVGADDTDGRGKEISPAPRNFHPMFPNLKKLRVWECPKLEFIFPISCVGQYGLVQLQEMEVFAAGEMKYVFGEYDCGYYSSYENTIQIMLPHLQVFKLENLKNLLGIFPHKYHTSWPSMGELSWMNRPKLVTPWINLEQGQHNHKTEVGHQRHLTTKFQVPESSVIFFGTLSFQYLRSLELVGCTTLKSIFSMVTLSSLSELKILIICNCDELVEIISDNEEYSDLTQVEMWLPRLEKLEITKCDKLKSLFCLEIVIEEESVLPNLRSIELVELPNFVEICRGSMFHKQKLHWVEIRGCPKFVPIFVATQMIALHHRTEEKVIVCDITINQLDREEMVPAALQAFLNIEFLKISESRVEGILQLQVGGKNAGQNSLNSYLCQLYLRQLPELRFIWGGNITVLEFHRLDSVSVWNCPKLKTIFPLGTVGSLQSLRELLVSECQELEEIIAPSDLQQMCVPKLWDIYIDKCDKLKCIFSDYMPRHFPQLSRIYIEECCEIERIFGGTRVGDENDALVLTQLLLRRLPNFTEIGHGIRLRTKPTIYEVDDCPKYTHEFI